MTTLRSASFAVALAALLAVLHPAVAPAAPAGCAAVEAALQTSFDDLAEVDARPAIERLLGEPSFVSHTGSGAVLHYAFPGCRLELHLDSLGRLISRTLLRLSVDVLSGLSGALVDLQRALEDLRERLRSLEPGVRVYAPDSRAPGDAARDDPGPGIGAPDRREPTQPAASSARA